MMRRLDIIYYLYGVSLFFVIGGFVNDWGPPRHASTFTSVALFIFLLMSVVTLLYMGWSYRRYYPEDYRDEPVEHHPEDHIW